ncbi:hypothetical protein [Intrasporangium flavum]|uniref:hypothetical protein n=1 Tax=Intrasporangium flavum TaxID=1428657 RepID=UPI001A973D20|nr:hypothetical protein [Intrasporangium flavum]
MRIMPDSGDSAEVNDDLAADVDADADEPNEGAWFAELKLDGERFRALGLPAESVIEVTHYRDAVFEVARQIYLDRHPDKERAPRGFDKAFDLRLIRVDRGSAQTRVRLHRAARYERADYDEWFSIYGEAADSFRDVIATVQSSSSVPQTVTPRQRQAFRKVGSTLKSDESVTVGSHDGTAVAKLDDEVRVTLAAIDAVVDNTPVPLSVVGVIVEFDSVDQTFELRRDSDNGRVRCYFGSYIAGLASTVRRVMAEDGVTAPDVQVTGLGIADAHGLFSQLADVSEIEVIRPWTEKRLHRKLAAIAALEPGWLGPGSQAVPEDVRQHFEEVVPALSRVDVHIGVAATADGHLALEWKRDAVEYLAEIEPSDRLYLCVDDRQSGTLLDAELGWDAAVITSFAQGDVSHVG